VAGLEIVITAVVVREGKVVDRWVVVSMVWVAVEASREIV
jgi:hypothetical protein